MCCVLLNALNTTIKNNWLYVSYCDTDLVEITQIPFTFFLFLHQKFREHGSIVKLVCSNFLSMDVPQYA